MQFATSYVDCSNWPFFPGLGVEGGFTRCCSRLLSCRCYRQSAPLVYMPSVSVYFFQTHIQKTKLWLEYLVEKPWNIQNWAAKNCYKRRVNRQKPWQGNGQKPLESMVSCFCRLAGLTATAPRCPTHSPFLSAGPMRCDITAGPHETPLR